MKKLLGIAICLILLACFVAPTAVAETVTAEDDATYLFNPTAIAVVGNKLFVADNIEEGKSVVLCFDVSGNKPAERKEFSITIDGEITNLSAKENGLYVVLRDKVIEYTLGQDELTLGQTFNVRDAVSFTPGYLNSVLTVYYASGGDVKMRNISSGSFMSTAGTFNQVLDIVSVDESVASDDEYLYVLYKNAENTLNCDRLNNGLRPDDAFNSTEASSKVTEQAKGLFFWSANGKNFPGMFSDNTLSYVEVGAEICKEVPLLTYERQGATIVDAVANNGVIYILNSDRQVEVFKKITDVYTCTATIGTDTRLGEVPSVEAFDSFTLVKSVGYPSNIVFKTQDEATGVQQLVDNAEEYIVLGYEGSETDSFHYVLYGDKFGWVKKSDGAASAQDDPNLSVVDTGMGDDIVNYKFVSLGAVWVYPLPRESFATDIKRFNQSATNRTDATVLQRFTEGDTLWYYVSYVSSDEVEQRGFVKAENVGVFMEADTSKTKVVGERKANGKLFGYVQLYDNNDPATMDDKHHAYKRNEQNETVEINHLSSGTRVTLIKTYENGTALVQVMYDDGTTVTGYCFADRLIKTDALTTNASFGLIVTSVAIVLAVVLAIVFVRRSKKKKADPNQNEPTTRE